MSDRMFASESEPVDAGRRRPAGYPDRWDDGHPLRTSDAGDDAVAGVARRLHGRLDRQLRLVDRMRADQFGSGHTALTELTEATHLVRHDTESLLLLCGREPGERPRSPRRLSDVLHDAAAATEEPRRIEIRSAPAATVAPTASVELLHVVAEVVDYVAAVHPGARVDLVSHVEPFGGIMVDVAVEGTPRHEPGGRRAIAAELLAQRSSSGVELRRSPDGPPPSGSAPVASVYCPAGAVTVEDVGWPARPAGPYQHWGNGAGSGGAQVGNGAHGGGRSRPAPEPAQAPAAPAAPVDELFGPLVDLPLEPMDDRFDTPIFEAIASAWFRENPADTEHGGRIGDEGILDWETPSDLEWRAAAARAARPEPEPSPSGGLPRRRPGDQLVPPARSQRTVPDHEPGERIPDRVRERLTTYQRGLRQGRHRAPGQDLDHDW